MRNYVDFAVEIDGYSEFLKNGYTGHCLIMKSMYFMQFYDG